MTWQALSCSEASPSSRTTHRPQCAMHLLLKVTTRPSQGKGANRVADRNIFSPRKQVLSFLSPWTVRLPSISPTSACFATSAASKGRVIVQEECLAINLMGLKFFLMRQNIWRLNRQVTDFFYHLLLHSSLWRELIEALLWRLLSRQAQGVICNVLGKSWKTE